MFDHSPEIGELATALALAQAEMKAAPKTSENPFFKSKYADLSAVWDACRGPLTKHGLSVSQIPTTDGVITVLMHTSGQWISGTLLLKPDKETPQAVGSAITYARRYALAAIVGVATEDDDAESAMDRRPAVKQPVRTPGPKSAKEPAEDRSDERELLKSLKAELDGIVSEFDGLEWRAKINDLRKEGALSAKGFDWLAEKFAEFMAKHEA